MLDVFKEQLQISSVFVMVDVRNWGNTKQVLADMISCKDGKPFKKDNLREVTKDPDGNVISVEPQFVQVYFIGPDFVYPSNFPSAPKVPNKGKKGKAAENQIHETLPRYGIGAFLHGFTDLFKHYYGYDPEFIMYGKPYLSTMIYV